MGENYDNKKESSYILYVDANNLYGHAMVQELPQKDLKFANETTLEQILEAPDDGETGYFCEVDLGIPQRIARQVQAIPAVPETPCSRKRNGSAITKKKSWRKRTRKQQRRNWCRT